MVRGVRGLIGISHDAMPRMDQRTAKSIRQTFGKRLRELRREAELSQEELATLAELDRSYIGGVERGERNISLVNIHKIARALKIKPEILFHGSH